MISYPSRAVASRPAASRPRLQLRCCSTPQRRGGRPPRAVSTELPAVTQPAISPPAPKRQFSNANFPTDAEGRTYHLGTKRGEVANRLLSVGSTDRAILLSQFLEPPRRGQPLLQRLSKRGFLTVTGKFNGQPVSIVSTMMGMPNMDFVVRENRAVVDGEMAVVRLGTCGAVQPPAALGHLMVAAASVAVRRDPDAFAPESEPHAKPYTVSRPIPADADLVARLAEAARAQVGAGSVVCGLNASADSFYSSQGRLGAHFDDRNEGLVPELILAHPELISLEMETFHLYDLARCSGGSVRAAAFCIALAERYSNAFIDPALMEERERAGGLAALNALASMPLAA